MLEQIKGLQYIIQHESIPLSEEKKILKEIKQLESTRGEVIANAAVRAKIQESVDKEALQDQVKVRVFSHLHIFERSLNCALQTFFIRYYMVIILKII